jgi:hypothetical protein
MSQLNHEVKFKETMIQVEKLNEYFAKGCRGAENMDIICMHIAASLHHGVLTEMEYERMPKLIAQIRKAFIKIAETIEDLKEK